MDFLNNIAYFFYLFLFQYNYHYQNNLNLKNISFDASTGLKVILKVPNDTTIKELLKKYVEKIGLSEKVIGTDLIFLFNGGRMDTNSEDSIQKFQDFSSITVFDQNNVIGA